MTPTLSLIDSQRSTDLSESPIRIKTYGLGGIPIHHSTHDLQLDCSVHSDVENHRHLIAEEWNGSSCNPTIRESIPSIEDDTIPRSSSIALSTSTGTPSPF